MVSKTQPKEQEAINDILRKAEDMHGHLGPFLALGVRMSLAGVRNLETKEGNPQLYTTVELEYKVPFSCMLDGIQTVTKCTLGNKRLTWKDSKEFKATFTLKDSGQQVEVGVKPALVKELRHSLEKKPSDAVVRQLALDVSTRTEGELFNITPK